MNLLIDTIPLLSRSKKGVVLFFTGAGVARGQLQDLEQRVENRDGISKYEIARTVLTRLNERGDATLRERREVVKRVVEFEDFSSCWPDDQLKAKGLVAEIQRLVNVKDLHTRVHEAREAEERKHREERNARLQKAQQKKTQIEGLRNELSALFSESNAWRRGKKLEGVLTRVFEASGILVREPFTITGDEGQGIIEQIDGVIEIDYELYLVELKWWDSALGPGDVAQHQVRVFSRGHARGIFISASGYTRAAVLTCKEGLQKAPFLLCDLEEIVKGLENERPLHELFRRKIQAAIVDKDPYRRIT